MLYTIYIRISTTTTTTTNNNNNDTIILLPPALAVPLGTFKLDNARATGRSNYRARTYGEQREPPDIERFFRLALIYSIGGSGGGWGNSGSQAFFLKLFACCGQYCIGYFLGKSLKVQQLIGVDKVFHS